MKVNRTAATAIVAGGLVLATALTGCANGGSDSTDESAGTLTVWVDSNRSDELKDIAAQFELSRPAVAEHLQVLRRAELVRDVAEGRTRTYHLATEPLVGVSEWLHPFEKFWRARLRAFADVVEDDR